MRGERECERRKGEEEGGRGGGERGGGGGRGGGEGERGEGGVGGRGEEGEGGEEEGWLWGVWYLRRTSLISSGSSVVDTAVDPTRSTNMTVNCRRSGPVASDSAPASGSGIGLPCSCVTASSSFRRCPTEVMPMSFRSSAVRHSSTSASTLFSRNADSDCSKPRRWSHAAISTPSSRVTSLLFYLHPCLLHHPRDLRNGAPTKGRWGGLGIAHRATIGSPEKSLRLCVQAPFQQHVGRRFLDHPAAGRKA